jgi:NAD(P)-dependent dehydrogenase (short-subunit alcohol dehydrogenase family)
MILKGKVVLITGAGRGIGRAIALECSAEGAKVVLLDRLGSELEETSRQISAMGGEPLAVTCDIASADNVSRAVSLARSTFGSVEVLVNNAGIQPPIGAFAEADMDQWKRNIEINLIGTVLMTREIVVDMVARKKGKIISLAGGGATSARPNFSAYAVSKTAIVRLTETLAAELKEYNIDVNAISPGAVNTKMLDEVLLAGTLAGNEAIDAEKRRDVGGDDPRLAAELVSFLASDKSDGITGKLISAKWDPWREASFQTRLRSDADFATLRRIDDKYFEKREA